MRIVQPAAPGGAVPPVVHLGQHSTITGLGLATSGNGLNRTAFDPSGGQANVQGNTVADSLLWIYFNGAMDGTGIGAPYQLWLRPLALALYAFETRLDVEGAWSIGIGDVVMDAAYENVRLNTTGKRVVLHVERNAGGGTQGYFVMCNGVAVGVQPVAVPATDDRITVSFRPGIEAALWYNQDRVARFTTGLLTGAASNITGAIPNSMGGIRLHKRPTGAALVRIGVTGITQGTIDR